MERVPKSQSIVEALDRLLLAIPEISELRTGYRAVADRPSEERAAWMRENAPEELVAGLRQACLMPELGMDSDEIVYGLLEAIVASDDSTGTEGVVQALLGRSVARQVPPNGTPYIVAVIHQFTDLDALVEQIRREHQQMFRPVGVRPSTIDDLAFVTPFLLKKTSLTEVAWELVYREHPHVRTLAASQREAEYGDWHRKAYNRVRWLKSKAIELVNELAPEDSQDSD